jgi:hypothetical protein
MNIFTYIKGLFKPKPVSKEKVKKQIKELKRQEWTPELAKKVKELEKKLK